MKALSGGANVNAKDRGAQEKKKKKSFFDFLFFSFFFFFFFFFFGFSFTFFCSQDGRTVVHIAVEEQNEKLLQYLITEPGVNLNLRDGQGQTPLYLAVSAGLKGIALMLAENGADIEGVEEPEANAGGAGGLDDEIDAAFQDLGLDMGDLDKLSSSSQPARKPEAIKANTGGSWEDEMAEMDRFLDEAGAGDGYFSFWLFLSVSCVSETAFFFFFFFFSHKDPLFKLRLLLLPSLKRTLKKTPVLQFSAKSQRCFSPSMLMVTLIIAVCVDLTMWTSSWARLRARNRINSPSQLSLSSIRTLFPTA